MAADEDDTRPFDRPRLASCGLQLKPIGSEVDPRMHAHKLNCMVCELVPYGRFLPTPDSSTEMTRRGANQFSTTPAIEPSVTRHSRS